MYRPIISPEKTIETRRVYQARQKNRRAFAITKQELPAKIDMTGLCRSIYDQGQLSSCTANALCQGIKMAEKDKTFDPSRLDIYYRERFLEKQQGLVSVIEDNGADPGYGFQWLQTHGICSEKEWPYIEANVNVAPPAFTLASEGKHRITSYFDIDLMNGTISTSLKKALASNTPVVIGVALYQSFMSDKVAKTGVIPTPRPFNYDDAADRNDPFIGGHALLLVGYNDEKRQFKFVNSWGNGWGDHGFGYFGYDYLENKNLLTFAGYVTIKF